MDLASYNKKKVWRLIGVGRGKFSVSYVLAFYAYRKIIVEISSGSALIISNLYSWEDILFVIFTIVVFVKNNSMFYFQEY